MTNPIQFPRKFFENEVTKIPKFCRRSPYSSYIYVSQKISQTYIMPLVDIIQIPLIILNMAGYFLSMRCVASPPSSRIILGCQFSLFIHLSMHHQKSSSVSPLHAKIGQPANQLVHQKTRPDVMCWIRRIKQCWLGTANLWNIE